MLELRSLVATRYRDLIYSADSIVRMKEASLAIVHNVDSVLNACDLLGRVRVSSSHVPLRTLNTPNGTALVVVVEDENAGDAASQSSAQHAQQRKTFEIAKQIKRLVDTPEKIWAALAQNQFVYSSIL